MHRSPQKLAGFSISLCAMLLLGFALPSASYAADPAGNSGTVKIDGLVFDTHHDNEPHPSCDFRVTFWGYGKGRGPATATFALQSPTNATSGPGSTTVGPIDVGTDAAGGGKDYDGQLVMNLSTFLTNSGATPHPKQGFHVKLTVHAPGSQGADVKHKVFWVKCAVAATASPSSSVSASPSPSVSSSVSGTEVGTSPDTKVLGTQVSRAGTARTAGTGVLGISLATTGAALQWIILVGTTLALLGGAMMLTSYAKRRKVLAGNRSN